MKYLIIVLFVIMCSGCYRDYNEDIDLPRHVKERYEELCSDRYGIYQVGVLAQHGNVRCYDLTVYKINGDKI